MTPHPGVPIIVTCLDRQPDRVLECERHSGWCHYVIVRADLPHGSQVAQTIHAAGESTPTRVPENTVAVALAARDRAHLRELAAALVAAGIAHKLIAECDGEEMAIGLEPSRDREAIRKVVSNLPLIR